MNTLHRAAENAARWLALAGGMLILIAAAVICFEVVLRRVFNRSFVGVDEISGYALAVGSSWAFAYALLHKAHVRIDTIYLLFPRRIRPWLDIAALLVLGGFMALLVYRAAEIEYLSILFDARAMTPLRTPLWVPQGLWTFGLAFFLAIIVLLLAMATTGLLRGRTEDVARLAAPASVQEELEEELGDLGRRREAEHGR